ncbi:MAG TPA: hypothetical protein DCL54_02350 [Alphaproteobacteria bacterium]|nr:hypothetical protein [Alphaproteobacteria bacterium]HAJ45407.1 hypothetical protein [Alphaproteobacteria bacterium]
MSDADDADDQQLEASAQELEIPEAVLDARAGVELLRFWISAGEEHVALNIGAMGEREVEQWGMILADISVHVIAALCQDDTSRNPDDLRAMIERAYRARLESKGISHKGAIGRLN